MIQIKMRNAEYGMRNGASVGPAAVYGVPIACFTT